MPMPLSDAKFSGFHLEITSLDAFAVFCQILRGEDPDLATLVAHVEQLKLKTAELAAAESSDAHSQP
jgi:hypothetical protein